MMSWRFWKAAKPITGVWPCARGLEVEYPVKASWTEIHRMMLISADSVSWYLRSLFSVIPAYVVKVTWDGATMLTSDELV